MSRMYSLTQIEKLLDDAIDEADAELWREVKSSSDALTLIAQANALELVQKHLRIALYNEVKDGDINGRTPGK